MTKCWTLRPTKGKKTTTIAKQKKLLGTYQFKVNSNKLIFFLVTKTIQKKKGKL